MTLDFKKFVRNCVLKQMQIQHFEANVQVFKREELPQNVIDAIGRDYGRNSVLDGDYWLFFSSPDLTRKIAKTTLFKIANLALGQAANNMVETELRLLTLGAGNAEAPEKTSSDVDSLVDDEADEANADAFGMVDGEEPDAPEDAGEVDESVESPSAGEKFVFLKITMK